MWKNIFANFVDEYKMRYQLSILLMICCVTIVVSQNQEIPYTLADRDRLIQVEADLKAFRSDMNTQLSSLRNEMNSEINSLRNEMNSEIKGLRSEIETNLKPIDHRFDAMNKRIDSMGSLMYWGFGILFSMMLFMLGFIIWDRRTTLAPVKANISDLQKENEIIKSIFREHSADHPKLTEILRSAGVL